MFVIQITYGGSQVESVDIERAEAAAQAFADKHAMTPAMLKNAYECRLEFNGWDEIERGPMPSHVEHWAEWWRRMESVADCALTEGWHRPEGASCSVGWES